MQIGTFLDAFPSALFIAAHVMFMAVGFWGLRVASKGQSTLTPVFWLYIVSQLGFLAFFLGGLVTLKMAVLIEQTLVVIMVGWIIAKGQEARVQGR